MTDVVFESVTGRLLAFEDAPFGSVDEWSDDVDARDGAIDISSSFLWELCSSTGASFSGSLSSLLWPKSCSFVPAVTAVVDSECVPIVPGSADGFSAPTILDHGFSESAVVKLKSTVACIKVAISTCFPGAFPISTIQLPVPRPMQECNAARLFDSTLPKAHARIRCRGQGGKRS